MNKKRQFLKRVVVFTAISLAVFFVFTFTVYLLGINAKRIEETSQSLDNIRYVLMAFRLCLIFAVWYFWEYMVVGLFPEHVSGYEELRETLRTKRNRTAVFFFCIEIFLAQNMLGYLLGGII